MDVLLTQLDWQHCGLRGEEGQDKNEIEMRKRS